MTENHSTQINSKDFAIKLAILERYSCSTFCLKKMVFPINYNLFKYMYICYQIVSIITIYYV